MASKIKRFSENIIWDDRREGRWYSWERVEAIVLKQFDEWGDRVKPKILSISFEGHEENNSFDLDENPRYFFLQVLYDDGNTSKIRRTKGKQT